MAATESQNARSGKGGLEDGKRRYAFLHMAPNGRITVPLDIREDLGVQRGGVVAFIRAGQGWVLTAESKVSVNIA